MELFEELVAVLVGYPSEAKGSILEHVYELLRTRLDEDVGAMKLLGGRFVSEGEGFVEGIRRANEELMRMARKSSRVEVLESYAGFVEEWCERGIDASLVRSERMEDEARRVTWVFFSRNTLRSRFGL